MNLTDPLGKTQIRRCRVRHDELDDDDPYRVLRRGQPFSGVAEELFADGALRFETEYRHGRLDGVSRAWRADGSLHRETWHVNGAIFRKRMWHPDGSPGEDILADGGGMLRHDAWRANGSVKRSERRSAGGRLARFAKMIMGASGPDHDTVGVPRRSTPRGTLDVDAWGHALLDGERFSGVALDRPAGGGPSTETEFRLGVQDGLDRVHGAPGQLTEERWYDRGTLVRERLWDKAGLLVADRVDDLVGRWTRGDDFAGRIARSRGRAGPWRLARQARSPDAPPVGEVEAREAAGRRLAAMCSEERALRLADRACDVCWAWVFAWNTSRWFDTGDPGDAAPPGAGPIVVLKSTGEALMLASTPSFQTQLARYAEAHGLPKPDLLGW